MSNGVVFENEESSSNRVGNIQIVSGAPTGILAWLVKAKVAKDGKEAERLLLIFAIIIILISLGIATVTFMPHHAPPPTLVPGANGQLVPLTHP
jgi:hypothetical protein